jgi:hypothetical protein
MSRVFAFAATLSACAITLASARDAGAQSATVPHLRRIAVVVGANDPPEGRQALRYAHDDANRFADTLKRVGEFASGDVHVLLDPHPDEVLSSVDDASTLASGAGGDALVLFYYSGHSDGQSVFPHGETLAISDLRARLGRASARIRVGILDTCRGGGWTQTKGLSVGPALDAADLLNVATEGTALVASSSGLENAHEADTVQGSFFTHHFDAGLLGAADRNGDGQVTLQEAFDYAKERTVRDSAMLAPTPQHPSFDVNLRGRQDIVLASLGSSSSSLEIAVPVGTLEVIHLGSGLTIAEAQPGGDKPLHLAVAPGRYLVRRVDDGHVWGKEVDVKPGETATVSEGELELSGSASIEMKGAHPKKHERDKPNDLEVCVGRCGKHDAFEISTSGVRLSSTAIRGTSKQDGSALGVMLAGNADTYALDGTAHGHGYGWIGGGEAGFEGALGGAFEFGWRAPVARDHGPFGRAGVAGEMMGNDRFYFSMIELPRVSVGYQYVSRGTLLEIGGRASPVITGRYNPGDDGTRRLPGTFAYGGFAALHWQYVRGEATLLRIDSNDSNWQGPVDVARGALCGVFRPVGFCGDVMVMRGDANFGGALGTLFTTTTYAGLTFGVTE